MARFPDIQGHWAQRFITELADRRIVNGFPDGRFYPDQPVTRAQFAVMLEVAFPTPLRRPYEPFVDVAGHWAFSAIRKAYETVFLSGYPNRQFRPNHAIPRLEALVSLVSGLNLKPTGAAVLNQLYADAAQIASWAERAIRSASDAEMVVNYPDVRQLRPQAAATRADVAAFIYQGLVHLGRAETIVSPYIVWPGQGTQTARVSHVRELRAVWVTSVWNKDWPSRAGLSTQQQQAELIALLDRARAVNCNAVMLQVRPAGDALYASQFEPWSRWLMGTQGQAPDPYYDPLEFAIAEAHKRNLELHAWFNPYRARAARSTVPVRPHIAVTNPAVVYEWGNQLWMDPGAAVVQERTYAVILDVVRRYDVDGIHLDDYFYPYPIAGQEFPDQRTYQAYRASGGALGLKDWRRDNVNRLVQRLYQGIRAVKSHVKFGISPFGIYRSGDPPQIQGLDAYDQIYADALKWLQQRWVDYLAPQLYWRIDPPAQSYPVLLDWWVDSNTQQRHIYAGNNLSQLDGRAWDVDEIARQVEITRQLQSRLALGNIFFSMNALLTNRQGITNLLGDELYRAPALPPTMTWQGGAPPPPPLGLQASDRQIAWQPASTDIRAWTLYREVGDRWFLQTILPPRTTAITVGSDTYAIAAVNRFNLESEGVVVTVR